MNQLIMIFLISLLILVHEAGHFIAARMCGIRVTRFGIGMPIGPSWRLFKWGHTVFYIHACLFGGYVSFPDDEPEASESSDSLTSEAEGSGCAKCEGGSLANGSKAEVCEANNLLNEEEQNIPKNELYESKTIAQKLFVVSAGVIMNIACAIVLVIGCAIFYQKLPTQTQNLYLDSYAKEISNAQEKGIIKGDKIEKVNSNKIDSLYQLTMYAKNSRLFDDYAQVDLIEKNLSELKRLNPQIKDELLKGQKIILPKTLAENELTLSKDMLKGLEKYKQDGILLDAKQIELRNELYSKKSYILKEDCSLKDIAYALSDTYKPMRISVIRDGKELTFSDIQVGKEGLLGMMLKMEDIFIETKTPKDVVVKSFDYLYTTTALMLKGLAQLITGKVSMSDMHGVIAVVKIGGDIIASKGLLNGILLTAMISINLAIMNFLPIPALDGGHVMFLVIEKLTGRKPSAQMAENINNFFFILLLVLMVAICSNDIFALVTKKF